MMYRSEKNAIQDDPPALFHHISVNEDSSFLLSLIEACTAEHWVALCNSKIFSVIQNVCEKPEDMLNGLKIFIACLKLVSHVELEDDERSYPAVVSAIQAAQTICQVLWRELECASPVRDFQLFLIAHQLFLIAHQLLHCLVQLGIGDEYQELFRDLLDLSPIISVAMHLWFYARSSSVRHQANLDRLNLVFRDSPAGCCAGIKDYLDGANPESLGKQLGIVIKTSDIDEGSLIECFAFLMYLEEKHPTRVNSELDNLANFVLLLHRIVDSDIAGHDVQIASVHQVNKLLEKLMEQPNTRIGRLHEIFQVHDGASLMADVALMVSQTWSPKPRILRRPSLFFDAHQQSSDLTAVFDEPRLFLVPQILQILSSNPPDNSPDMPALLSILLTSLRPIWHSVLSHLRSLDSNKYPGAPQVTKMWTSLGTLIGVHKLVTPMVGCTWVECPRFVKETDEEMAVCTRCDCAQYCDEKCQKMDWKTHKATCHPAASDRTLS